ncbi:hypothetical protein BKA59DRAFT_33957 [Fusarium tricinctum]|uniref:Uncharacterized protein n=1 Tax=Fusarium tricinctum TaxID=61284 RepID=A0A8K0S522_9HYPO|nr:hypothetical protein BKA59DRAFT_33957 [Fusarium tricinctum]
MVTTRSITKTTAATTVAHESRTTSIQPKRCSQAKPPAALSKRKRTKADDDSPIPCKITKTEHSSPQAPGWLLDFIDEVADENPFPQSPTGSGYEDDEEASTIEDEYEEELDFGIKSFGQDTFAKNWSETEAGKDLEYFQAYPHDRDATLCADHFLELAESWYFRRMPLVSEQLRARLKGNLSSKPDFSGLALPIDENTWTVKTLEVFMGELRKKIEDASSRMHEEKMRVVALTLSHPLCELGNSENPLKCAKCPKRSIDNSSDDTTRRALPHCRPGRLWEQEPVVSFDLKDRLIKKLLNCGHESPTLILGGDSENYIECSDCFSTQRDCELSFLRPWNSAIKIAGTRFPVAITPASMSMNSQLGHVDVGGLHIVVDACVGVRLIKFR